MTTYKIQWVGGGPVDSVTYASQASALAAAQAAQASITQEIVIKKSLVAFGATFYVPVQVLVASLSLSYAALSITRASAVYVQRSAPTNVGTIFMDSVPANTLPRENLGDGGGPIGLFDGQYHNYILTNRNPASASWNAGVTYTPTAEPGPDEDGSGTKSAVQMAVLNGGFSRFFNAFAGVPNPSTASVWIAALTANQKYDWDVFDGAFNYVGGSDLTNRWRRLTLTVGVAAAYLPVDARGGAIPAADLNNVTDLHQVNEGYWAKHPILTTGATGAAAPTVATYLPGQINPLLALGTLTIPQWSPEASSDAFVSALTALGGPMGILSIDGANDGIFLELIGGNLYITARKGGVVKAKSLPLAWDANDLIGSIQVDAARGLVAVGALNRLTHPQGGGRGEFGTPWAPWVCVTGARYGGVFGAAAGAQSESWSRLGSGTGTALTTGGIPADPAARFLVFGAPGQSNEDGADSLQAGAPGNIDRNDARCFVVESTNVTRAAGTQIINASWDPAAVTDGVTGYAYLKEAANVWLDSHAGVQCLIVDRAVGSSLMTQEWKLTNPGAGIRWVTPVALRDFLQVLRVNDIVCGHTYKGESEAVVGGADAANFAANVQAWITNARARFDRPNMPWYVIQLPNPGPGPGNNPPYTSWTTIQAQILTLASGVAPFQRIIIGAYVTGLLHIGAANQTTLGGQVGTQMVADIP